ncbi:MAG: hypothetical protein IPG86_21120 [Chitinophagaceae bacterium]|nr:hypothetical protein [Chitinophagaceae bacterium]
MSTNPLEYMYSTVASPTAVFTWSVTGDAQIRNPFSGAGINEVQVLFGQTPGPRNITVQFNESSCSLSGVSLLTSFSRDFKCRAGWKLDCMQQFSSTYPAE